MCTTCGCGGASHIASHHAQHDHHSHDQSAPFHHLQHQHAASPAQIMCDQEGGRRIVQLTHDILGKNKRFAEKNRQYLHRLGVPAFNLVSSPGAGKTMLLARSIREANNSAAIAVIEGDQHTSHDAACVAASGAQAIQINTGKGCHLDAHMIGHALEKLTLTSESLLFIENGGNLVCTADFDLGETQRVVLLSVVEGDDKPLKYPYIFASADLMLLTKMDLLPYVSFDVAQCIQHARRLHPTIEVIRLSTKTGVGLQQWYDWIANQRRHVSREGSQEQEVETRC